MERQSILIVEDQPTSAKILAAKVEHLGYSVSDIASSGEQAVQMAADRSPSAVLMDIKLGQGMDGIEAARLINEIRPIPVVYVSAYADDLNVEKAKEIAPGYFINKPVRTKDLRVTLRLALGRVFESIPVSKQSLSCWGALEHALGYFDVGVVVLSSSQHILFTNRAARNFLSKLGANDKQLYNLTGNLAEQFAVLERSLAAGNEIAFLELIRKGNKIQVLAIPLPAGEDWQESVHSTAHSIILLFEEQSDADSVAIITAYLYGLTVTEARLAGLLTQGMSLKDAANALEIAPATARVHVRNIFGKLDAHSQNEMLTKIMSGPAGKLRVEWS
jgi:DNA-binding NarL/FixJ family response regulator